MKLRLSQKGRQQQNQVVQNPFSLETDVIRLCSEKGNSQSRRGETRLFSISSLPLPVGRGVNERKKVKIELLGES